MRIYVAGASGELSRAEQAVEVVRSISGLHLTSDWPANVRGRDANRGLSEEVRARESDIAIEAVRSADLLWLLIPSVPTSGTWFEFGTFLEANRGRLGAKVIASGGEHDVSIFTARANRIFRTDGEAAVYLRERYTTSPPRQLSIPWEDKPRIDKAREDMGALEFSRAPLCKGADDALRASIAASHLPTPGPFCDCDLRDRQWNPNTGRCEFCGFTYLTGR